MTEKDGKYRVTLTPARRWWRAAWAWDVEWDDGFDRIPTSGCGPNGHPLVARGWERNRSDARRAAINAMVAHRARRHESAEQADRQVHLTFDENVQQLPKRHPPNPPPPPPAPAPTSEWCEKGGRVDG